jgi:hypothetical protein
MARDNSKARSQLELALLALDGARPAGTPEWVSAAAPVVTQAAVGAGHWAAGRRQRALAAWASAAGSGLVAWGLGTEAPTRAETVKTGRPHRGPAPHARHTPPPGGVGYRRDANTPQPAIAERPVRPCLYTDGLRCGLRRAVGPAPPAAADSARDRQRDLQHRDLCPAGGPGRAAAQAEDSVATRALTEDSVEMEFLTDDPVAQAVTHQRVTFDARAPRWGRYGCATAGRVSWT